MSLRSFGGLKDGPTTIVEGVLAASSTVLSATMAPDLFGSQLLPMTDRQALAALPGGGTPAHEANVDP